MDAKLWVLVVVIGVAAFFAVQMVRELINDSREHAIREALFATMKERAKAHGPIFITCADKSVTALCPVADFEERIQERTEEVATGGEAFGRVWTKTTVVFCSDQKHKRSTHIFVTREEMRKFQRAVVQHVTGVSPDQVDEYDYGQVRDLLFQFDDRLFVPFGETLTEPELKKQLKYYGTDQALVFEAWISLYFPDITLS